MSCFTFHFLFLCFHPPCFDCPSVSSVSCWSSLQCVFESVSFPPSLSDCLFSSSRQSPVFPVFPVPWCLCFLCVLTLFSVDSQLLYCFCIFLTCLFVARFLLPVILLLAHLDFEVLKLQLAFIFEPAYLFDTPDAACNLLEEREVLLTNTLRNFLENGRSASGDESSEELRSSGLTSSSSRP